MPTLFSAVPVVLTAIGWRLFWINGTSRNYNNDVCYRVAFCITFLLAIIYNTIFLLIDAMTGNGADDSFFYHLEHGVEGAGLGQHLHIILVAVCSVLIGVVLSWITFKKSSRTTTRNQQHQQQQRRRNPVIRQMIPFVTVLSSFAIHPFSFALHQQYSTALLSQTVGSSGHKSNSGDDDDDWEPSPAFQTTFQDPNEIVGGIHPQKNIIHIYMESLERNYLLESPDGASRLRKWEGRGVSFSNIDQAGGTGYTVAGLVASMCGIPLLTTGGSGASMAHIRDFLPGATCLPDLLKRVGYHNTFMGGAKSSFAGKGDFLKSHGFDTLLGKDELHLRHPMAPLEGWGIQDDVLLDAIFDEYKKLSAAKQPFTLYGLTVDTHGTDPSPRCKDAGVVRNDKTYLDSARCTDYLVDQLIQRVFDYESKRGRSNNTLIIVSSDHLAMNYAQDKSFKSIEQNGPRRNTFFVLDGQHQGNKSEANNQYGTTLDVPATILSLLGYPGKAFGFGRDLMTNQSLISQDPSFKDKVLTEFGKDIRRKSWMLPTLKKSSTIYVNMKRREMTLLRRVYTVPILISTNEKGTVEDIFLYDRGNDATPVAFREHHGSTIAIDQCRFFTSGLKVKSSSSYCLFVKHYNSSSGWIRLLKPKASFSVEVNTIFSMTEPAAGFVGSIINNTEALSIQAREGYELWDDVNWRPFNRTRR